MTLAELAGDLRAEACRANERRLLVLAGPRQAGIDAAYSVVESTAVDPEDVSFVTTREGFRFHRLPPTGAGDLLGTTREIVVLDCHADFSANTLGQVAGAVDGGGLLVLLTPPLAEIPTRLEALVDRVAVPPFDRSAVGNRFRHRLVETLSTHPGVAIAELEADDDADAVSITVDRDGLTQPPADRPEGASRRSVDRRETPFPTAAFAACLTDDQARAVAHLSALSEPDHAVVLEADRGRGKSSAAGLAAGSLAAAGRDVLVTAPAFDNAAPIFTRAERLLDRLDVLSTAANTDSPRLTASTGGRIRFRTPPEATPLAETVDVVIADEAAAIPVDRLESLLAAPAAAFCTTVHGYEGTGRGFDVRFRDRLAESHHRIETVELAEPIRYARGDPVESWLFRTLLLDAAPPVDQLVAGATPERVDYRRLTQDELAGDEQLLRSVFGLLVVAHYRTEPTDLVRLLDAPNLEVCALEVSGHVVSVAVLAREGGLDADLRASIYEGQRVRGNMLPDVLTSQLRDEAAAGLVGYRVMRIATHHAARSKGLGSYLLERCHAEFADAVDWFGVGYGATPRLVGFWRANDYRPVHLSITANDRSGEHSALMLRPSSAAGRELVDRHTARLRERIGPMLCDVLSDVDPDVVRELLAAAGPPTGGDLDLTDREWQVVAGVGYGPGTYEAAPGVFRRLSLAALSRPVDELTERQAHLLIRKVLQGEPWASVAEALDYASTSQCMREMGAVARTFCAVFGGAVAEAERERYE
ncbi:tRNA(Met) cytidine acetyltransferase TmcA [Halohasta salina]|uniref:tRNA(Met) cytidine acetyltransferase TmcA n=1 Tax=Halohasta salina TaxID=2961621 RepID=UPI0020A2B367|nr:tRNA(Met) cytidine acetyltransferase TmcA [Halohasta salina]